MPSGSIISLPSGSQGIFSRSSRATMSVPPVLAPCVNTMPMPSPITAPPHRAASMGSMGAKVNLAAMTSMAVEPTSMDTIDPASSLKPIYFQPSRNRGIFMAMVSIPTGRAGITWLITCARPVMPPSATSLGA